MNDQSTHKGRSGETSGWRHTERNDDSGTPAPELVIVIPLEDHGRAAIRASSPKDAARLRLWLRRTKRLRSLEWALQQWLDDLDARDAA